MRKNDYYRNKIILVTGGAGSIGSAIVRGLLRYNPSSIRILDNNEAGIFNLTQILNPRKIRPLIGDIRDEKRVERAMQDVDIVFHAAALKHVPLSEYNPLDVVQTNILGTQNVISGAIYANVKKVINISTDKAVNPVNVLGATKLVSERLMINAHHYVGKNAKTVFSSVRFGNVLNSTGSVIPIFKEQIKKGGPVTVTSAEITRFFMNISKAVDFILTTGVIMKGRDIFIPKMPAVKIIDLAHVLIEEFCETYNKKPSSIKIKIIGIRPGEKIYESLITDEEATSLHEDKNMFILRYDLSPILPVKKNPYIDRRNYDSRNAVLLSKEEVKKLLSNGTEI